MSARTRSGRRTFRRVVVTGALIGLPLMAVTGTAMADPVHQDGPNQSQDRQHDQDRNHDQDRKRDQDRNHDQDWQQWWNQAVPGPQQHPLPPLPQPPAPIFGS